MRTKHYLAALCLPMAFAACSNEDFVNEAPFMEARGTVNVTLNAEKPTIWAADTRLSINQDNKFVWEKDLDMIGAAMADGTAFSTINADHKVSVNYPFTAQASAETSSFNAKSAIVKGHYLFYYGYTDVIDREYLDLSVPTQTYKVGDDKTAIQQAASQMKMIAPIVNLAEGVNYQTAQTYNLNLSFVNLYTMVKVTVNSTGLDEKTPKLEKITLNAVSGNGVTGFVKQAHANLAVIAGSMKANVVTPIDGVLPEEDMTTAKAAVNTLIGNAKNGGSAQISTIYDQTGIGSENKYGPATLIIDGDLALSAEPTVLYLLAPKGTYDAGLTLTVETSEGTYTKNIAKPASGSLTLGDNIQPISADLDFEDGGNVVLPDNFTIASADDWSKAVAFVQSHSSAYIGGNITFTLGADIEIAAFPAFPLTIAGKHVLTLTEDYTFDSKKASMYTGTNVTLGVKEGAALTLDATSAFAGVMNHGVLNVNAAQDKSIINYGTMNVGNDVELSGGVTNGMVDVEGTINVSAGKTLTISNTALTNTVGDINIAETATMTISSVSTNAGTINNDGEIICEAAITNTSMITNNGTISISGGSVVNEGTIDNYGTLPAVTNTGGTVIAQSGSTGSTVTAGTVEVKDAATFGSAGYTGASNAVITVSVKSKAEYDAIKANNVITNITLDGGSWILDGAGSGEWNIVVPTGTAITGLTLKSANLALEVALEKNIVADGESSISATAPLVVTGKLTVNADATLTVNKGVTFNELVSGNTQTADIQGNLIVNAGAAMYFNTAEVGAGENTSATLTVNGNISDGSIDEGKFGVQTTASFNNYGKIAALKGDGTFGKVSGASSNSEGSFSGPSSAFSFD